MKRTPPSRGSSNRRSTGRAPAGGGLGAFVHDVASPLAAIQMSAHALRASGTLSARNLADVRRIEDAAGVVSRMAASLEVPRGPKRRLGRAPVSEELVDLYVVCCDLAQVRRRLDDATIHCRAFGDPRGRWDRRQVTRVLADVLDHAATHLGDRAPMAIVVTGMARHVRVDVHGFGWLSPHGRQTCLEALSKIGGALAGAAAAVAVSPGTGGVFTLRMPR